MSIKEDDASMLSGIKKLLGKEAYDVAKATASCEHASDGMEYQDEGTTTVKVLRCAKCGTYYEKHII